MAIFIRFQISLIELARYLGTLFKSAVILDNFLLLIFEIILLIYRTYIKVSFYYFEHLRYLHHAVV